MMLCALALAGGASDMRLDTLTLCMAAGTLFVYPAIDRHQLQHRWRDRRWFVALLASLVWIGGSYAWGKTLAAVVQVFR